MQSDSLVAGKRLLILDGTQIGREIVLHAQRLGVVTIVADYNEVANAPAKQIADEHVLVSITDVDAVVQTITDHRIDGVVAGFSDMILPYYAEICERAGLPAYGNLDLFRTFTDKSVYKKLCTEHDVPVVEGYSLTDFDDQSEVEVRFPVILKPARGSGSRGVRVCHDRESVRTIAAELNAATADDLIIEQFLDGDEATAFWLFGDGTFELTMLANRHTVRYDQDSPPLPYAYTSPSAAVHRYQEEIAPAVQTMLEAAGVRDGMMFMQGIVDRDGVFRTYDIGYRVTGTQEYRLLEELAGINPLDMLICFALTGRMLPEDWRDAVDPAAVPYSFNVSVSMAPGTVHNVTGLEEVRAMSEVVSAIPTRNRGDVLPPEGKGQLRQIAVRVLGTASSSEHLLKTASMIRERIRIVGDDGRDLTLDPPALDVTGRLI
ncbi:MAG: ATP-grasp domain-containing protein [Canibacter sp.]